MFKGGTVYSSASDLKKAIVDAWASVEQTGINNLVNGTWRIFNVVYSKEDITKNTTYLVYYYFCNELSFIKWTNNFA